MTETTGGSKGGKGPACAVVTGGTGASLVYATFPGLESATAAANALVEAGLAACVNIVPGVVSVYRWEGRVEQGAEVIVLIKTRRDLVEAVMGAVRLRHPYGTPALVAYDVAAGSADYLDWIGESTSRAEAPRR